MEAIVWNKKLWLEAPEGAHSCSLKADLDDKLIQARNDALEEAAKIAEEYGWEIKWRGEPWKKTKAGVTGEDIAQAIRQAKEKV